MLRFARLGFLFAISLIVVAPPQLAHAQLDGLLKQLQGAFKKPGQDTNPSTANDPKASKSATKGSNANPLIPSDEWCSQQVGALGSTKVDTAIIATEFRIGDLEALQDDFMKALRKDRINRTFQTARFWRASFETKRVRAIYDSFLAFPEPEILAALIQISREPQYQESVDAQMALVFLHLQAPELSIDKDRWWALYQKAQLNEQYTALVFRARLNAYGEYGPKNLNQAVTDLAAAGRIPGESRKGDSFGQREFDMQNYQLQHTATVKDIYNSEPNMPYRAQWAGPAQTAMQIEKAQENYARALPNTRVGRMYAEATRVNGEAIQVGNEIIKTTQGGNQLAGQIANLQSLRSSSSGEKPVFEDISPEVQVAQLRMVSQVSTFDDQQRQMLVRAQQKRYEAQGILAMSFVELMNMVLSSFGGDIVKMAAPLPALAAANNALIQSCLITSKWEQAMRAKDVPKPDIKKVEASVADLSAKYKD